MKHLDGRASGVVHAPLATCFAVLEAVEHYPAWSGEFIREVDVLARDDAGRPQRAHVVVHIAHSPVGKEFEFDAEVTTTASHTIALTRVPGTAADPGRFSLLWSLREGDGTRIELALSAQVSFLPRFLPLPGVGDKVAGTLLSAAVRELGGSAGDGTGARSSW
jgi:uncharacterized membrane protein